MGQLLQITDLETHFYSSGKTTKALDGVSFEIEEGETFGLVGESGCGKSVTALSILRLIPDPPGKIVGGKILFKGRDLLEATEREIRSMRGKEISMIFQEPMTSLNPVFRIGQQVADVIRLHQGTGERASMQKAVEMLAKVHIPDAEDVARRFPHQLSGGMRQRVMIAMELSCRPSLLIADEPTTALDVTIQAQILELVREMRDELQTSILLITHDLGVVAELCDQVAVMYAGSIVERATVDKIFAGPKHPYTQGLWGAIPPVDEEKSVLSVIPGSVPDLSELPQGCKFHPRCSFRFDPCTRTRPPLIEGSPGHFVSCWLYTNHSTSGITREYGSYPAAGTSDANRTQLKG
ncbi:MAG TPA: ABC transporter ATP-binding protein [Syntrophorhabdaceae bacterium]|nr:ABC transporter ATP-binding protein [Syntrophorhabdaceae bacterium]